MTARHLIELDRDQLVHLENLHPDAASRYDHYRRCGFGPRFSLDIAVAWAFNQRDEDTRAVGHGTGAE